MNIERLNINVNGIKQLGFCGGRSWVTELEDIAGGKIPASFITFIEHVNGGHPEVGSFCPLGNEVEGNFFDVDWFYAVEGSNVVNLKDALLDWKEVLGKGCLPIGRDAGGNQIYLDLNEGMSSVWIYVHDVDEQRLKISNDFSGFVDSLFMNPDFI